MFPVKGWKSFLYSLSTAFSWCTLYVSISVHSTGNMVGLFNMKTCVLPFWELFMIFYPIFPIIPFLLLASFFFFFKMLALLTSLTFCKMLVLGSPCFILFFLFLISISEICFSFYNSFSNFSPKIFIKFFYLNYHVSISNIKKKNLFLFQGYKTSYLRGY